jgi:hypothetical protein
LRRAIIISLQAIQSCTSWQAIGQNKGSSAACNFAFGKFHFKICYWTLRGRLFSNHQRPLQVAEILFRSIKPCTAWVWTPNFCALALGGSAMAYSATERARQFVGYRTEFLLRAQKFFETVIDAVGMSIIASQRVAVTSEYGLSFSRRDAPELCSYFPPLRGRGECRAPNAPAAWRAKRVTVLTSGSHHE